MAAEQQDVSENNMVTESAVSSTPTPEINNDPMVAAFATLVGDLTLDLARGTMGPAVETMHKEWRNEAAELRRETAEWISRVNTSRQRMEQTVEQQHALSQEVYDTHAKLLQDMTAFQKERRDAQQWQEQVSATLTRLSELHRELSVESTRIAGVVRDIIAELARYQSEMDKQHTRFEEKIAGFLTEQSELIKSQLQSAAQTTEEAMEALSKTNEETRSVLARDITALRREVQEVATRVGRDLTESRAAMQQHSDQRFTRLEQVTRGSIYKTFAVLFLGELAAIGGVVYLYLQLVK